MTVFDEFDRMDMDFAAYGEGNFSFLNRSNQPQFAAARGLIEEWFSRYPPGEQEELAARFRDKNNPQGFDSPFFELFLHEFFVRGGCQVEVHPRSNESSKRPDFLITTPTSGQFYLEAIVASGMSKEERAANSRKDDLYNALNQVRCPDYFIHLQYYEFKPSTPIPVSKIKRDVQRWIDSLDYEDVMSIPKSNSFDVLPSFKIEHDGNAAKLVAVPKKREFRGQSDAPTLGGHSGDVTWGGPHGDIRAAIKKKSASRYALGGLPYVVAIRCPDALTRAMDVERALFGMASNESKRDPDRMDIAELEDGIWAGSRGATNTSLSGVMAVWNVFPWSVTSGTILLYRNPWAKRPLNADEPDITEATLTSVGIEYIPRDSLLRF